MMIYQAMILTFAFLAGSGIGFFYFSGLWWTLKRLPGAGNKGLLMFCSLWIRSGVSLAGFYMIMNGEAERLIACLLGFISMRYIFSRMLIPLKHPGKG